MDIIAAKFADPAHARAAARDMRVRLRMNRDAVDIRPLGTTQYDEPVSDVLLAGRFPADRVAAAIRIVESHGGVILDRRSESDVYPGAARRAADAADDRASHDGRREGSAAEAPALGSAGLRVSRRRAGRSGVIRWTRGPLRHPRSTRTRASDSQDPSRNGSSR